MSDFARIKTAADMIVDLARRFTRFFIDQKETTVLHYLFLASLISSSPFFIAASKDSARS